MAENTFFEVREADSKREFEKEERKVFDVDDLKKIARKPLVLQFYLGQTNCTF